MRKRVSSEAVSGASDEAQTDRQFITSLHRGLEVLRAFRPDDRAGLSNGDIAERTGLPNSTVSRLTYTLLETGYLSYDKATGRYRMGVPVLALGYACLSGLPIREAAQPHMQDLADSCGEGVLVALGGRDGRTMTYIACARTPSVVSLQLGVGSRISLARSAMGRAWLAACPDEERDKLLAEIRRSAGKEAWPALRDGIRQAAAEIASRGFYANLGEWNPGVHSVAVPFPSAQKGGPLLAFNLGGPAGFLPPDRLTAEFGPRLVRMAESLSQRMRAEV